MFADRLNIQKKVFLIFIIVSVLLISYLHYSSAPKDHILHTIYTELHYIPLIIGAIVFGLRGALIIYIFISVLYLPYFFAQWSDPFISVLNRMLHLLLSGVLAFIAGFIVDREKKYREQAEKDRYLAGLGQAAAAIVHDLKNPLITIMGFARRIKEGKANINTSAQAVIDSAGDMQKIVNDVLDFANPHHMELREADICEVISKACDCCKMKADEKGIILSIHLPTEPISISIERSHIERALTNLINNAIEASLTGKMVVVRTEKDKGNVNIRIRDYGEGMDKETLENIFIPFYTRKRSGTGLGMAIAKKIIEGHQGSIHIDSREHAGTEIIIELPL
ncbi:MAG: sensor histidine kinase [Planctomycetota bacterium]|jgi:signal transduction histidine kinase